MNDRPKLTLVTAGTPAVERIKQRRPKLASAQAKNRQSFLDDLGDALNTQQARVDFLVGALKIAANRMGYKVISKDTLSKAVKQYLDEVGTVEYPDDDL